MEMRTRTGLALASSLPLPLVARFFSVASFMPLSAGVAVARPAPARAASQLPGLARYHRWPRPRRWQHRCNAFLF